MEQLAGSFIAAGNLSAAEATGIGGGLLIVLILWVLPWKGYALWTAAKRGEKWWFAALLVINTLAILEIIYIFFVAKKKNEIIACAKKFFRR